MTIELIKFGNLLTSRQLGKEALAALTSQLPKDNSEEIIVDFTGVSTFSPSWGDEFLSPLQAKYQNGLNLKNISNPSVKATIEILEETNQIKFQIIKD
jgi:anti-anti-sigma regulatory factor